MRSMLFRLLTGIAALFILGVVVLPAQPAAAITDDTILSEAAAKSYLAGAGITRITSTNSCNDRYNRYCTSLEGIRYGTINGLIQVKNRSGCAGSSIVVTGGTEVGHAYGQLAGYKSHFNGWKIDIKRVSSGTDACITTWLQNYFPYLKSTTKSCGGVSTSYQILRDPGNAGDEYAKEPCPDHWDILYN